MPPAGTGATGRTAQQGQAALAPPHSRASPLHVSESPTVPPHNNKLPQLAARRRPSTKRPTSRCLHAVHASDAATTTLPSKRASSQGPAAEPRPHACAQRAASVNVRSSDAAAPSKTPQPLVYTPPDKSSSPRFRSAVSYSASVEEVTGDGSGKSIQDVRPVAVTVQTDVSSTPQSSSMSLTYITADDQIAIFATAAHESATARPMLSGSPMQSGSQSAETEQPVSGRGRDILSLQWWGSKLFPFSAAPSGPATAAVQAPAECGEAGPPQRMPQTCCPDGSLGPAGSHSSDEDLPFVERYTEDSLLPSPRHKGPSSSEVEGCHGASLELTQQDGETTASSVASLPASQPTSCCAARTTEDADTDPGWVRGSSSRATATQRDATRKRSMRAHEGGVSGGLPEGGHANCRPLREPTSVAAAPHAANAVEDAAVGRTAVPARAREPLFLSGFCGPPEAWAASSSSSSSPVSSAAFSGACDSIQCSRVDSGCHDVDEGQERISGPALVQVHVSQAGPGPRGSETQRNLRKAVKLGYFAGMLVAPVHQLLPQIKTKCEIALSSTSSEGSYPPWGNSASPVLLDAAPEGVNAIQDSSHTSVRHDTPSQPIRVHANPLRQAPTPSSALSTGQRGFLPGRVYSPVRAYPRDHDTPRTPTHEVGRSLSVSGSPCAFHYFLDREVAGFNPERSCLSQTPRGTRTDTNTASSIPDASDRALDPHAHSRSHAGSSQVFSNPFFEHETMICEPPPRLCLTGSLGQATDFVATKEPGCPSLSAAVEPLHVRGAVLPPGSRVHPTYGGYQSSADSPRESAAPAKGMFEKMTRYLRKRRDGYVQRFFKDPLSCTPKPPPSSTPVVYPSQGVCPREEGVPCTQPKARTATAGQAPADTAHGARNKNLRLKQYMRFLGSDRMHGSHAPGADCKTRAGLRVAQDSGGGGVAVTSTPRNAHRPGIKNPLNMFKFRSAASATESRKATSRASKQRVHSMHALSSHHTCCVAASSTMSIPGEPQQKQGRSDSTTQKLSYTEGSAQLLHDVSSARKYMRAADAASVSARLPASGRSCRAPSIAQRNLSQAESQWKSSVCSSQEVGSEGGSFWKKIVSAALGGKMPHSEEGSRQGAGAMQSSSPSLPPLSVRANAGRQEA